MRLAQSENALSFSARSAGRRTPSPAKTQFPPGPQRIDLFPSECTEVGDVRRASAHDNG